MTDYEFDENGLPKRVPGSRSPDPVVERNMKEVADAERRKRAAKAPEAKDGPSVTKAKSNKGRRRSTIQHQVVNDSATGQQKAVYTETLPNGGIISMSTPAEMEFYQRQRDAYQKEYAGLFIKPNDLNRLSQLLTLELIVYRNSQRMVGQVVEYDAHGKALGIVEVDPMEQEIIARDLPKMQDEIRKLETALKLDKKTREGSSEGDIRRYMENLKKAAIQYKVHLSERYTAADNFISEVRWRRRVMGHDLEDRKVHGLETDEKFHEWLDRELQQLEELDKQFAKNKQALWVGDI